MKRIYAVILAAGTSSRLGRNKLMLAVNGQPVIRSAVEPFLQECIKRIFIITNPENKAVRSALEAPFTIHNSPFTFISNERYREGMSSSVKAALPYIEDADAVFFHLGDKPFIRKETVKTMKNLLFGSDNEIINVVVPVYKGRKGHPVLMRVKPYLDEMRLLEGDKGLREIIEKHSENVLLIEGEEGNIFDIDTEKEINILRERGFIIEKDKG